MTEDIAKLQFEGLGTEIEMRIVVANQSEASKAKKDLQQACKMFGDYAKIFSRFDPESELSKFNNSLGDFLESSFEFLQAAYFCLEYHKKTDGLFDPRIITMLESIGYCGDFKLGGFKLTKIESKQNSNKTLDQDLLIENGKICFLTRMDFSGMAKGFIVDETSTFLKSRGWKNFLVDAGGDMFFGGLDLKEKTWNIDVDGIPCRKMMLALSEKGLATSGISRRKWEIDGKRFHHIVNPKKPSCFLFDLKTVTVVADSTQEADVWAKTLFLFGKEGAIIEAKKNNLAAVILDYRGNAWISPKAKEFLHK